tara:strand:- start:3000 stop:3161 length:162 start_codon:yes stop_codon:yes gene_type:complete
MTGILISHDADPLVPVVSPEVVADAVDGMMIMSPDESVDIMISRDVGDPVTLE